MDSSTRLLGGPFSRRQFIEGVRAAAALGATGLWESRAWAAAAPGHRELSGPSFDLEVAALPVNFTGHTGVATAINGLVPRTAAARAPRRHGDAARDQPVERGQPDPLVRRPRAGGDGRCARHQLSWDRTRRDLHLSLYRAAKQDLLVSRAKRMADAVRPVVLVQQLPDFRQMRYRASEAHADRIRRRRRGERFAAPRHSGCASSGTTPRPVAHSKCRRWPLLFQPGRQRVIRAVCLAAREWTTPVIFWTECDQRGH